MTNSQNTDTDDELDEAAQGHLAVTADLDAVPELGEIETMGEAAGIPIPDGAVLGGADEIARRDAHRWELDPASAEDAAEKR